MEEACKECRTWEEDIYWTHFRSIHFVQFLDGDFDHQLAIPKKFAENLRNMLPEYVIIKGPGSGAWRVAISGDDENLYFKHGWEDFVNDHGLQKNDILVFRYNGESCFSVLVFNRQNLCEREASYFHRKCGHNLTDNGFGTKRKMRDPIGGMPRTPLSRVVGQTSITKDSTREMLHVPLSHAVGQTPIEDKDEFIIVTPDNGQILPCSKSSIKLIKDIPFENADIKKVTSRKKLALSVRRSIGKSDPMKRLMSKISKGSPLYVSNRRPVKPEEVSATFELAHAASTIESFIVVMRPTHVYKRFYLSIPNDWASKHVGRCNKDVVLRMEENTWHCRYTITGRGWGGLSSGWKKFAIANNLEQSDVCLFEPAKSINETVVLDVTIFRVVEDVVPPTLVTASA